jgi:hypothetical protein
MKKLFTLIAFLTCFLGAKAGEVIVDKTIDYSSFTGFPFYVMGYVPEFYGEGMTDLGGGYKYVTLDNEDGESSDVIVKTQAGAEYYRIEVPGGTWHQYFIATGIATEVGGSYTVTAMVKANKACSIPLQMRWSWGADPASASADVSQSDDFVEVTWEFSGIDGASCDLIAQPNTDAEIVWKSLKVTHEQEDGVAQTWLQYLTDNGKPTAPDGDGKYVGDAEFGAWPAWSLELTDGINANWRSDRAGEICAWSLTMGKNLDDQCASFGQPADRARPYPSDIEAEEGNESNHVFAVHVEQIDKIDDDNSIAWSNQFWIQSPKAWKSGTKAKVSFRYKAKQPCSVDTQTHKFNPSVYDGGSPFGTLSFTTEWQEVSKEVNMSGTAASIAFNLCSDATNGRTPNVFYFDDLSWEVLKVDEGLFVASTDTRDGTPAYDVNAAQEFVLDPEDEEGKVIYAVVGKQGDESSWVNEVMISTARGDKSAFNGATISVPGTIKNDDWTGYQDKSQAKIKLPAAGVWKIMADTTTCEICFYQIEGDQIVEKVAVDIVTNDTEIVIDAVERESTSSEEEGGTGNTWDNQFFLYSNRDLAPGEETIIEFEYKATKQANSSVAFQGVVEGNADYITGAFNMQDDDAFDTEWKTFKKELTMPEKKWDGKSVDVVKYITFDLACIKEANTYTFKNIKWYLKDDNNANNQTYENLINATGTENFAVKIGAGTNPYQYGTDPSGIINVKKDAVKADGAIYNLAGQRVSKDYKGIVVKAGKKTINF